MAGKADPRKAGVALAGNWFARLRDGLARTRERLASRVYAAVAHRIIDESLYEELEEALIAADVGVPATAALLEELRQRVRAERLRDAARLPELLRDAMRGLLASAGEPPADGLRWAPQPPTVVMVVGVNGVGKTTTIGKLAAWAAARGRRPLLAAGDTFRAAAAEQLAEWARRAGADLVRHAEGADAAAVVFDAIQAAAARGRDLVLADTAGRLHTKSNLMEELKKVRRVMGRACEGAPHDVLLVLDATTGQNAIQQARAFHEAVGVDGIVLTKLDGTAKGGVALAVVKELGLPIRWVGVGEGVEDLRPFDAEAFIDALLPDEESSKVT
ncbi:MAG: signal recognition particle-docking protein FtsY [Firmicutes bacterium]|nr:signal recognition particle-docking protein FtsY [Bacillota bacterium]